MSFLESKCGQNNCSRGLVWVRGSKRKLEDSPGAPQKRLLSRAFCCSCRVWSRLDQQAVALWHDLCCPVKFSKKLRVPSSRSVPLLWSSHPKHLEHPFQAQEQFLEGHSELGLGLGGAVPPEQGFPASNRTQAWG